MTSWADRASCRGAPVSMFFPTNGRATHAVRALCGACPVSQECLDEALKYSEEHDTGIRAGLTAAQRRALRMGSRQSVDAPEPVMLRWDSERQMYLRVSG